MSMAHSRYCAQPNRESSIRSDPIELNSSQEPFPNPTHSEQEIQDANKNLSDFLVFGNFSDKTSLDSVFYSTKNIQ